MKTQELKKLLKEHLTLDVCFERYRYSETNLFTIKLLFDNDVICEREITIDPTQDKNYY